MSQILSKYSTGIISNLTYYGNNLRKIYFFFRKWKQSQHRLQAETIDQCYEDSFANL